MEYAMTESDLKVALMDSQLPHKTELAALARPAIHALATPGAEVPVGASRVGGLPDLPKSLVWPTWTYEGHGHLEYLELLRSMAWPWGGPKSIRTPGQSFQHSFVAQLNLAELPDVAERRRLPSVGHLYFFYCQPGFSHEVPDCYGSWAVLHSDQPPAPMAPEEAGDAPLLEPRPAPLRLTFSEMWTVPTGRSIWFDLADVDYWPEVTAFMKDFYRKHDINMAFKHQIFGYSDWLGTHGERIKITGIPMILACNHAVSKTSQLAEPLKNGAKSGAFAVARNRLRRRDGLRASPSRLVPLQSSATGHEGGNRRGDQRLAAIAKGQ